jgi:hypothetical protein
MKKIKKAVAMILSLVLSVTGVCAMQIPVSAAEASEFPLEMQADSTSLNQGDTVTVSFALKTETAIAGVDGYLNYDTDVLKFYTGNLTCTSEAPKETDAVGNWNCTYSESDQKIELKWSVSTGSAIVTPKASTKLFTLKFNVIKSAAATTIRFQNPSVYLDEGKTQKISNPSGLSVTVKNSKIKEFTIETENVSGNSDIAVPVKVTKNGGFSKLNLVTTYDSQKLVFDKATVGDSIKSKVVQGAYAVSSSGSQITIPYTAASDISDTGTLCTLHFKVTAKAGTSSAISMTTVQVAAQDVTSTAGDYFVMNSAVSTVVITEGNRVLGDVSGDDKINLVDALFVIRYVNNVKTFSSVEKTAADVNKDGTVDLVDALLIIKYYNGEVKSF